MQIINLVTGDTDLTHGPIIVQATSDDGRITYRTDDDGPCIDARKAFRGAWWHSTEQVPAEDWEAAIEVMSAANRALSGERDRRAEVAHAAQDARIDALAGIESVRGGAYDPRADGWN